MTRPPLLGMLMSAALLVACGPDQGPPYAGANALQGKTAPVPAGGKLASECTTPTSPTAPCSVSYKDKVYPTLNTNGSCSGCHASTPATKLPTNAEDFYKDVTKRTVQVNKEPLLYVNACSKDPAASSLWCHIQSPGTGGDCGDKMPSGGLAAADQAIVKTWLECGAPNN